MLVFKLAFLGFVRDSIESNRLIGRWRRRGAEAELQSGNLRLLCVFLSAFAIVTYEMKVVLFCIRLGDAKTSTMLPDIALFACHAV